ncbi:PIN domain-containing protein [Candidatus Woesearchaeota archaeon]|nr:PIN domain-containing protein [Candidatus Woesearchaeota archaeon]
MFADTDFFLAIIKESDWLKDNAVKLFNKHKGSITTSVSVMIEIAILCDRHKLDVLKSFANIFEIAQIDSESYAICMNAAFYMKKYGTNVFDSFHAAYCGDGIIISSDSAYEKIGIARIRLEEK